MASDTAQRLATAFKQGRVAACNWPQRRTLDSLSDAQWTNIPWVVTATLFVAPYKYALAGHGVSVFIISVACTPFELEKLPSTHLLASLLHSCKIESAFVLELYLVALDLCDCYGFLVTLG
jgi:hypothetical protein